MPVQVKRIYDPAAPGDGERILVDRLWPRGISKEKADLGEWMKDIAPSADLRKWYGHKPERWDEFRRRYREELESNPLVEPLRERIGKGTVTLLYGARDRERNQAVALADYLTRQ